MEATNNRKWQRLATIATVGCALLLLALSSQSSTHENNNNEKALPRRKLLAVDRHLADCENTCKDPPLKDKQHFDGADLIQPAKLLERFKEARQQYVGQLKKDYGEKGYKDLFEPEMDVVTSTKEVVNGAVLDEAKGKTEKKSVSAGRNLMFQEVVPAPPKPNADHTIPEARPRVGWSRFVNKLQMKVLQIQLGILEERKNAKAICLDECSADDQSSRRFLGNKVKPSTGLYSKFTWATGGHSASAGHGNFFRESYTAVMGEAVKPIFKTIGIEFEARNHAMGGTDSADEISLCYNAIFGRDIDFFSWDYGMTDGRNMWKILMYAYKAAQISRINDNKSQPGNINHRPAFFGIHSGGREKVIEALDELGMTVLNHNGGFYGKVTVPAMPEMMGLSEQQIAATPPLLRYLKCGGKVESGDPGCGEQKWNHTMCDKRKFRTSWHPGWKHHALVGNMLSLTFLDGMEDAIQGLIEANKDVPAQETDEEAAKRLNDQLKALDQEEKKNYENMLNQPIPDWLMDPHVKNWWNGERMDHLQDMDIQAFYKEPSFCHTATLPAQQRFMGLTTENFSHVSETIYDQQYDTGVPWSVINNKENPNPKSNVEPAAMRNPAGDDKMMLVKVDDSNRQKCDDYLNLDYKDYFHVSSMSGWQTLTLPNDSEAKYYKEFDAKKSKGYILACMVRCDWGRCPEGSLSAYFGWTRPNPPKGQEPLTESEISKKGHAEILINGEKVTEVDDMHTCKAFKNKNGHVWKPNDKGQYEVKMRITGAEKYAFLHFAAFVLV